MNNIKTKSNDIYVHTCVYVYIYIANTKAMKRNTIVYGVCGGSRR